MKYEFTKDYLTGIDSIDQEHARLFEIANELYDLMQDRLITDKYDKIIDLIQELRDYTKTHFKNEEAYMTSINYQHIWSERHQHLMFIKKLDEIDLTQVDDKQQEYVIQLLDFLARWLQGHIKGADKRIGEAVKAADKASVLDK